MDCTNLTSPFGNRYPQQASPLASVGETPLTSQKSVFSLTLDEFQNSLGEPGKNFGSMNMDELVKNIWTAEEGQAIAAAMGSANATGLPTQKSLQKQGSVSLKGAIGQKTVDEVWNNIYQEQIYPTDSVQVLGKQREISFREVTLEDFLIKAGIVPEEDFRQEVMAEDSLSFGVAAEMPANEGVGVTGAAKSIPISSMYSSPTSVLIGDIMESKAAAINQDQNGVTLQHSQFLNYPPLTVVQGTCSPGGGKKAADSGPSVLPTGLSGLGPPNVGGITAGLNANPSFAGFNNPLTLAVHSHKTESPLSSDGTGTSQGGMPLSPVYHSGTNLPFRKRLADGQLETVVERRQRRMIKNRESAARSRARKQAYTVELENEINELRAENEQLKLKQENADRQLTKVLALTQEDPRKPQALLRSRTGPW